MKTRVLLLGLLFLTLAGCAPKGQPILPGSEVAARWLLFQEHTKQAPAYEVLSGSLRFGTEKDTRRVTYTLWSGPSRVSGSRAIRLSVNAGAGANVANILFDAGRMLLVLPREGKAYEGLENEENIRKIMGMALPMSITELNDFLAGGTFRSLDALYPTHYRLGKRGGIVYVIPMNGRSSELELDEQGMPIRWKMPASWELSLSYNKAGRPDKLNGVMNTPQGEQRMVLLVKERRPITDTPSLELDVPQGMPIYFLDH